MGCAESKPANLFPAGEVIRDDVPRRIEYQTGKNLTGWKSCTIGRRMDFGEEANTFQLRVDNSGGGAIMAAVLKKPDKDITFEAFEHWKENLEGHELGDDDDAFTYFTKLLPTQVGSDVDVLIIMEGAKLHGRLTEVYDYQAGDRLAVLLDEHLLDATVVKPALNCGTFYNLKFEGKGGKRQIHMDLNSFNHCKLVDFGSVAEYENARTKYLEGLAEKLSYIEDAITGNSLNMDDQIVSISIDTKDVSDDMGSWKTIVNTDDLAVQLVRPSAGRPQGTHEAQGVLLRAGPGTGKTVSMHQLTRLIAKRLLAASGSSPAGRTGASHSAVEPAEQAGPGVGLVPMLISVQRLATYMKRYRWELGGVDDLLRSYIGQEFCGDERAVLLQAYQMRALVCAIDGVDEAAALKSRIEDLVVDKLAPFGVRTIVSSRPEGVRLERYKSWVVMDLKPLSDAQQQVAIAGQIKNSNLYTSLSALSKLRRGGATDLTAGSASYDAVAAHITSSCGAGVNVSAQVGRILDLFDQASVVPVMLSMIVLCLENLDATTELPTSRLHLYKSSVRASILRRSASLEEATSIGRMLAKVAVANHIAQHREFNGLDVWKVLSERYPQDFDLFKRLDASTGVPLIKTLEVGDTDATTDEAASKYQFTHLSFQESFFAEALCAPVLPLDDKDPSTLVNSDLAATVNAIWSRGALKLLNDRWLLNTFAICGGALGPVVAKHLGGKVTTLRMTEHQVKSLVALDWEALRGQPYLTHVILNVGKTADFTSEKAAGVQSLAKILDDKSELPALAVLDFGSPVSISTSAAAHLAAACVHRQKLRLYGKVCVSQFNSFSDSDAVLVAATLRGAFGVSVNVADACLLKDGVRYRIGVPSGAQKGTLADALKATGTQACPPKDIASHLMLAGYGATDLRTMLGLTTGELGDLGFTANEIAAGLGSGPPSTSTLRELADHGLVMELVATQSLEAKLEDVRNAGCSGIPSDDDMDIATDMAKIPRACDPAIQQVRGVDATKLKMTDAEGAALIWALALYGGKSLGDITMGKNAIGIKTATAISQFLRFNKSVKGVDLNENQMDDACLKIIGKALTINGTLEKLRLSDNPFGKQGTEAIIEGIFGNCSLKHVALESNGGFLGGSSGLGSGIDIAPLKGIQAGEKIDLESRSVGPFSSYLISKMMEKYRPQVSELIMLKNPIRPEGAGFLAEMIKGNDDVKLLDLRFCALGPEGFKLICNALKVNTSVEKALLLTNSVSSEGAKAFDDLLAHIESHGTSLRYIDIQDNLIAPDLKALFKEKASSMKFLRLIV